MKELIERLRNDCYQEDEVRAHAKEAADALERLTAELAKANSQTEEFERKWYLGCDEIENLTIENAALKEGLDGWHSQFLDMEVERDALLKSAERNATLGLLLSVMLLQEKRND